MYLFQLSKPSLIKEKTVFKLIRRLCRLIFFPNDLSFATVKFRYKIWQLFRPTDLQLRSVGAKSYPSSLCLNNEERRVPGRSKSLMCFKALTDSDSYNFKNKHFRNPITSPFMRNKTLSFPSYTIHWSYNLRSYQSSLIRQMKMSFSWLNIKKALLISLLSNILIIKVLPLFYSEQL